MAEHTAHPLHGEVAGLAAQIARARSLHAEPGGLPHVSIEIRQDLISSSEGADRWARILGNVLADILADDGL